METIETRAKAIAEKWKNDIIRGGEDLSFTHLEYVAKQAATEQDSISRKEERDRCIMLAQDWYCRVMCVGRDDKKKCATTEFCLSYKQIRKALEGGKG